MTAPQAKDWGHRWGIKQRVLAAAARVPPALRYIIDPAKRKSARCPRRAGKTRANALYLLLVALLNPGCRCLYIALTRNHARTLMWDALKMLALDLPDPDNPGAPPLCLGLTEAHFNETLLEVRCPNGAVIRLLGMDDRKQMHKVLGDKYRLVIVDEGASFHVDLAALVKTYLGPATLDQAGTIAMTGTPGDVRNYFYEVTDGNARDEWSQHEWSTLENPFTAPQFRARLEEIERTDPLYKETAEYAWMYLGRWVTDDSLRVYKFNADRNLIDAGALPKVWQGGVLAIDLGWDNATAFALHAWAEHDPNLYILRVKKRGGLDLDDVVAEANTMTQGFTAPLRRVVDGAAKQSVEHIQRRLHMRLEATEKTDKSTYIRAMNTDLVRGRVKLVRGECLPLIHEWTGCDEDGSIVLRTAVSGVVPLVWDRAALEASPPKREEDGRCANDASDTGLYGWRMARNYRAQPADPPRSTDPEDIMDAHWEREAQETRERMDDDRRDRGGVFG